MSEMEAADQETLSLLLARHREGLLEAPEKAKLDALMDTYRRGLVLKARALNMAVTRWLRPPLTEREMIDVVDRDLACSRALSSAR